MATTVVFPKPKDPSDAAWYSIRFAELLASVISVTATLEPTNGTGLTIGWVTPGDALAGGPVVVLSYQLAPDAMGVLVYLSGGVPGSAYAIEASVLTLGLAPALPVSTLNRSVILLVQGL